MKIVNFIDIKGIAFTVHTFLHCFPVNKSCVDITVDVSDFKKCYYFFSPAAKAGNVKLVWMAGFLVILVIRFIFS